LTEPVEEERFPLVDDDTLVERLRAGDKEALGRLFLRHANPVRRLLVSVMGPSDEVEDLVQEVFLAVHRSIAGFRGNARFSTWLHRVTVNTALNALRRPRRTVAVEPVDLDRHSDRASGADTAVLVRERVRRLYAILDAMTPKRRVAFTLFELEGRSIAEVAEMTGVALPVAKSRIFFARRELKKRAREDAYLAPLLDELGR